MKMALGDAIERPILDVPDLPGTPMQQEPLNGNTSYDDVAAELLASEGAISEVFIGHFEPNKLLTHADFFGMGIGRRALALSSGFRLMIEHRNSLCALPMVRMQLDTALRLYAGFFVTNHQKFCLDVLQGKQIDRLKSDDGLPMKDRYLVDRVATLNPWIVDVYKFTSGYIHFSNRHIQEAVRRGEGANAQMVIGPTDFDREPKHFLEPMRCMHHLNLIIGLALRDWFARMCDPNGIVISASELWGEDGLTPKNQP
jgi:hypothetical protein